MAKTYFSTSNALTKKAWDEKLFRDTKKESYFDKFAGTTKDSVVYVQEELEKGKGDQVTCGIRMRLSGVGVTGDSILEGNEEALSTFVYSLTLEQYRHAVRSEGQLSDKRPMFSIDEESRSALLDWGSEKIDQLHFDALQASYSKVLYLNTSGVPTTATSIGSAKAGLHATNSKLTPEFISYIKAWARTGGNRSQTPLRPVKVMGKEYFVLLANPEALYDLKVNSNFLQAQREAENRGKDNPIFSGAVAIYDGVIIHDHENVTRFDDGGGAAIHGNIASLLGAQSLCWAWGKRPKVVEKTFDYDNQKGYAWGFIGKAGKPQFDSKDYGSIGIALATTTIS